MSGRLLFNSSVSCWALVALSVQPSHAVPPNAGVETRPVRSANSAARAGGPVIEFDGRSPALVDPTAVLKFRLSHFDRPSLSGREKETGASGRFAINYAQTEERHAEGNRITEGQPVAKVRYLATRGSQSEDAVFSRRRAAFVRPATGKSKMERL